MCSLINKQLLLTAYAYLYITEQQKGQRGSEALELQMEGSSGAKLGGSEAPLQVDQQGAAEPRQLEEKVVQACWGSKVNRTILKEIFKPLAVSGKELEEMLTLLLKKDVGTAWFQKYIVGNDHFEWQHKQTVLDAISEIFAGLVIATVQYDMVTTGSELRDESTVDRIVEHIVKHIVRKTSPAPTEGCVADWEQLLRAYIADVAAALAEVDRGQFERLDGKMKNNQLVCMAAVQRDVGALRDASAAMQNNKQVVMEAVQNSPIEALSLLKGSHILKDPKVVKAAISRLGCTVGSPEWKEIMAYAPDVNRAAIEEWYKQQVARGLLK